MKLIRMPPIDRDIYKIFKIGVEKRNNGKIWGNLPEEIEKALIFYDKCGKDLHYINFHEMNEYLEGVSWKVVVDADGQEIHDLIEQFIWAFGDVELIQKNAIIGFIEVWTGKNGNYTYRKYSKQFRDAGLIRFDNKIKVFKPTHYCKKKFCELKESKENVNIEKFKKAVGGQKKEEM